MTIQLNLRMNEKLFSGAKHYSEEFGYENVQDFIRETIREKIFDEEKLSTKEIKLAQKLELLTQKHNLKGSMEDIENLIKEKEDEQI